MFTVTVAVAVISVALFPGCDGVGSDLTGIYICRHGEKYNIENYHHESDYLDLNANGSFSLCSFFYDASSQESWGVYKVEGDYLILEDDNGLTNRYLIQGDSLVDDYGNKFIRGEENNE